VVVVVVVVLRIMSEVGRRRLIFLLEFGIEAENGAHTLFSGTAAPVNAQGMAQPDVVWKKKKAIARTTVVRVLFFVRVLML
jgi:hypothetical protein